VNIGVGGRRYIGLKYNNQYLECWCKKEYMTKGKSASRRKGGEKIAKDFFLCKEREEMRKTTLALGC
jgi:hypothetical protein